MSADFEKICDFVHELEKLKLVARKIKPKGMNRYENTAEHSWQVAMLAMSLLPYAQEELDGATAVKMLLLHDVVEIDTGDKFAYAADHLDTENETVAAERIFGLLPETLAAEMLATWLAFETGDTPESRFAKGIDRLIPVLQNVRNEGQSWVEHGITQTQILAKNSGVKNVSAELWDFVQVKVQDLVDRGLIAAS